MPFTKTRAEAILKSNFGSSSGGAKIALLTILPGESDSAGVVYPNGKEVETTTMVDGAPVPNGYQQIDLGEIEAQMGYIQNKNALHFPEAQQSWGTVVGFKISSTFKGLNEAATGSGSNAKPATYFTDSGDGFYGALKQPVIVPKETIPLFRAGYIRIGLDHMPPDITT